MPELPEVETVKRGLQGLLPGKVVKKVSHDTPKSFPNAPADVDEFLIGTKILEVKRRAKVLLIELESKYSLVVHLKMTGQMVFVGTTTRFGAGHPNDSLVKELPDTSTRVVICLAGTSAALEPGIRKKRRAEQGVQKVHRVSTGASDDMIGQEQWQRFGLGPHPGHCDAHLFFNDQRKFGWMRLMPTAEVPNIDFMKKVGPEPLEASFTAKEFRERLMRRKNSNIKAVLLDQTVIAGVGNIYADESLWGAKIHPTTLVKDLPKAKTDLLLQELRNVMELSIEKGGSSSSTYVNAEGKKGSYLSFANVFRREGKACARCGTTIEKSRVAGRGTHICPVCQKR